MKCQKCNKNEANVQYREFINGNEKEIFLCSDCAAEIGLMEHTSEIFRNMEREMLSAFSFPFGRALFSGHRHSSLPLSPAPEVGGFFENDPVESMETVDTPPKKEEKKDNAPETVDELKARLLDAIADERYEDAAKLRDKIKNLKGE